MGCCGDIPPEKTLVGTRLEGDILAAPKWHAIQKTHGRISSRYYGRINRRFQVWIDPRDFTDREWVKLDPDSVEAETGPTPAELKKTLDGPGDPAEKLAALVKKADYGLNAKPRELAEFSKAMQEAGVKTVLEISTGESAGLARLMIEQLGFEVTTVAPVHPKVPAAFATDSRWTLIEADPAKLVAERLAVPEGGLFDLVVIDAGADYEAIKSAYEKYGQYGRVVAFQDVSPETPNVGKQAFWQEISRTPKTKVLRKDWHETIAPQSKAGIGWTVRKVDGPEAED